jgi:hypothetical protein
MRKALMVLAAVVALLVVAGAFYGWPPPERKQQNLAKGLTYFVWPWPSGVTNDPHKHEPPLWIQPALLPAVVDQIAQRMPASYEYPAWFVDSRSPDGRYEVRSFVDNANDYWYVKNLKTGQMLVFLYGTHDQNPVWQGNHLVVDSQDFDAGIARLHVVVNLDRLAVEEAVLLKW